MTKQFISLDIGGANIKIGTMEITSSVPKLSSETHIFPVWQQAGELTRFLSVIRESYPAHKAAVTLTAELADVFPTKRHGVIYVLEAVKKAFSEVEVYVLTLDGKLESIENVLQNPLQAAGANWIASAWAAAQLFPTGILADTGSTTTDLIPFNNGVVTALGKTDPERLVSGELVYTGILRTPCSNLAASVPLHGTFCSVSPEYFTITADVHLILGHIQPEDYQWPTPDGKEKSLECARARLARLVCGDTELLNSSEIDLIAHYLYDKQVQQLTNAIYQLLSRLEKPVPIICAGSGSFLPEAAAARIGLETIRLTESCNIQIKNFTTWSLCYMLAEHLGEVNVFEHFKKGNS